MAAASFSNAIIVALSKSHNASLGRVVWKDVWVRATSLGVD